jgi:hypothetical protein
MVHISLVSGGQKIGEGLGWKNKIIITVLAIKKMKGAGEKGRKINPNLIV